VSISEILKFTLKIILRDILSYLILRALCSYSECRYAAECRGAKTMEAIFQIENVFLLNFFFWSLFNTFNLRFFRKKPKRFL
jgi:hypothetical protein